MTTSRSELEAQPAAAACLQASMLLRRRIHRYRNVGVEDQQALVAVCQLLDALSHGLAASPSTAPSGVERAAARLVDQLRRTEITRTEPDPRPVRPFR